MIGTKMFRSLRFNIELSDKTGSVVATVFQRDAEGMFGISTEYMKDNIQQVGYIAYVIHNTNFFLSITSKA